MAAALPRAGEPAWGLHTREGSDRPRTCHEMSGAAPEEELEEMRKKAGQKKESSHLEMNHIIGMQKIKDQNYGTYIMGLKMKMKI